MKFQVELKQASGREHRIVRQELKLEGCPETVRALIEETARAVYGAFLQRKHSELPTEQVSEGKIAFGFFYNDREISEDEAVAAAVQAFEDGLVVLFIDGVRHEDPNERLSLKGGETLTFVKLTMLAGRLW